MNPGLLPRHRYDDEVLNDQTADGETNMTINRQNNPVLPAVIVVLFLALLVFLLVSRK